MTPHIIFNQVSRFHEILIREFGGSDGIRDEGLLNSAIERPFVTFDQEDLYPNPVDKAAAIMESITKNHPLIDGNKRMGYLLMRLLLLQCGTDIKATEDEKYDFVISVAKGELDIEGIKDWLNSKVTKKIKIAKKVEMKFKLTLYNKRMFKKMFADDPETTPEQRIEELVEFELWKAKLQRRSDRKYGDKE